MVFSQSKWKTQFNNFIPTGIYLLKVNSINPRISCETCSKLTISVPERRQCCSDVVLKKIKHFSFDSEKPFQSCPKKIYTKANSCDYCDYWQQTLIGLATTHHTNANIYVSKIQSLFDTTNFLYIETIIRPLLPKTCCL